MNDWADPLKILQVADTRWLSIAPAVVRILSQWTELKLHFQSYAGKDKCYKADLLYHMYSTVM